MIADASLSATPAFEAYFGTPRLALLDLLRGSSFTDVLEVGCGSGANLATIQMRFPDCATTGVELQPEAAKAASARVGVDRVLQGDVLDSASIAFPPDSFDLVVLSHVLEHFAQPEEVLARCKTWLRPGGRLLIALPNVRHASVLRQLVLEGDFRYHDAGILDRTHLRFYTRLSALRFIESQGFKVIQARGEVAGKASILLDRLTLGVAREFAAFAYNFLAVRT